MKHKALFYLNTTIHMFWTLLLLLGSFFIYKISVYRVIHLALVAVTISAQAVWKGCPLTLYESHLRKKLGSFMKPESFVAYYTQKLFGVTPPMWLLQTLLGVVAVNALIPLLL